MAAMADGQTLIWRTQTEATSATADTMPVPPEGVKIDAPTVIAISLEERLSVITQIALPRT